MPRVIQTSIRRAIGGYEVKSLYIALSDVVVAGGTVFSFTPTAPGHVVQLDFITTEVGAGAGATITFTPAISGTSTTGGDVTVTLAGTDTVGEETAGNPTTGGAEFSDTDTVSIVASGVTVFTAGTGYLKLLLEYGTRPVGPSPT